MRVHRWSCGLDSGIMETVHDIVSVLCGRAQQHTIIFLIIAPL